MSEIKLGETPEANEHRDAIHVAVVPMVASEMLRPAQRIGVVSDGVAGPSANPTGIVDPFLSDVVPKGQRFWFMLFPGTVTGMRHHWEHPAFSVTTSPVDERSASEQWLRDAAVKLGVTYEEIVSEYFDPANGDYINNGEHIRDIWYEMNDEFWIHRKVVVGVDVPEEVRGGFTCSC